MAVFGVPQGLNSPALQNCVCHQADPARITLVPTARGNAFLVEAADGITVVRILIEMARRAAR